MNLKKFKKKERNSANLYFTIWVLHWFQSTVVVGSCYLSFFVCSWELYQLLNNETREWGKKRWGIRGRRREKNEENINFIYKI